LSESGYQVRVPRNVARAIGKLPPGDRKALFLAVVGLEANPGPPGHAKLKVKDLGEYRIRVRGFRVRYDVDDEERTVCILAVKPRREAYRT
jgi:mRNA-degrading endonuclease RelE of RelBE toxin-antitoxin system